MPTYSAPIRDMRFVLHEVWNLPQQLADIPAFSEVTLELADAVLEEAAKLNEQLLAPLNKTADQEGCQLEQGNVSTPKGFKNAYRLFCECGWPALTADPTWGGQGLPHMLGMMVEEMLCSSCVSFSLYLKLTQGVCKALNKHASESLKAIYLPKMISGEWSGAMCLTEPHCGSDLSLVRTKAEPLANGNYTVSGTKIFITSGEHDLAENIIHLVLARTPNAPPGIKGISLFLVPKFLVNADGTLGNRNGINCGALEHKMGIKGSATCVINYDEAEGYLVGQLNQGMAAMFTVMNVERLCIGVEGLGLATVSYQNALEYAKNRRQGRAITNSSPDTIDAIIVHPDIRRMLLIMKSFTEGARALLAFVAAQVDNEQHPDPTVQKRAGNLVELFTPIIKAYFTDTGFEACNLGVQILGGHGYISEWGMEQFVRDARISMLYEGTNGIQALDLVRRKIIANNGEFYQLFSAEVLNFIQQHSNTAQLSNSFDMLNYALAKLKTTTDWILLHGKNNFNDVASGACDYLKLFALVALGYMWAKMELIAASNLSNDPEGFYQAKIDTSKFYFAKVLPQVDSLEKIILAGGHSIMELKTNHF